MHPVRGVVVPAQHGWFAVYRSNHDGSEWAEPVIAWRYYDMQKGESAEPGEQGYEMISGNGLGVPAPEGDDAIEFDNQMMGFRWMPELYSRPQDVGKDVTRPVWTLKGPDEESEA